jgi:ubiquinone biosynthesis protein
MSDMSDGKINKDEFKEEVKNVIEPLQGSELGEIKLSHVLEEILDIALKYKLKMPIDFVLFGKTIVTLEGIALEYDPKFNIVVSIKPFIEKLVRKSLSPKKIAKNFIKSAVKFNSLLNRLPGEAEAVLNKIKDGTIKVDVEDTDIRKLSLEIDKSSNRLVYGMIIAALLVASALTIQVSGPTFLGLPLVSFITFVSAMTLLFIFFVSVVRGEKT